MSEEDGMESIAHRFLSAAIKVWFQTLPESLASLESLGACTRDLGSILLSLGLENKHLFGYNF